MNEMVQTIGGRMPSVDWVAFGVAVVCTALAFVIRRWPRLGASLLFTTQTGEDEA